MEVSRKAIPRPHRVAVWPLLCTHSATVDIDLLVTDATLPAMRLLLSVLGYEIETGPMEFRGGATVIHRFTKVDGRTMKEVELSSAEIGRRLRRSAQSSL